MRSVVFDKGTFSYGFEVYGTSPSGPSEGCFAMGMDMISVDVMSNQSISVVFDIASKAKGFVCVLFVCLCSRNNRCPSLFPKN